MGSTALVKSEPNTTPRSLVSDVSGAPTHTSVPESVVAKQVMPAIGNNSGKKVISKPVSKPNSRPNSEKNGTQTPISKPVSTKNSATKQKANSVMGHPTVHDISPNLPKTNQNTTRKTMPADLKLKPIVKIKSKQIRKKTASKDELKNPHKAVII